MTFKKGYDKHSEKINKDSKTGRFLPKSREVKNVINNR